MTPAVPRVRLVGVTKTWPENGVVACRQIDLDLNGGEVLALLGENGAGKSTLVGILAGTIAADAGQILVDGVALGPRDRPGTLGIALLPQHPALAPDLTLAEHVFVGAEGGWALGGWTSAARLRALDAEAARWGFRLDWRLTGAQAGPVALQKATLVALFRRRPRVLLLDEPTAALPGPEAEALLDGVARWAHETGASAVLITHKLEEARRWADRIAVLRAGRLVALTTAAESDAEALGRLLFAEAAPVAPPPRPRAPGSDAPPVLETRGTSFDLALAPGEVLGLTSLRGEGVEALEEVLTGWRPLTEGQLLLAGADVTGQGIAQLRAQGLSYVPSDRLGRGSSPQSAIASNLIPYRVGALTRRGLLRRRLVQGWFQDLKAQFGLAGEAGQRLATLSGGNIQRLILVREIEAGPRVVVLAEPGWGLDLAARRQMWDLIRAAADQGAGALVLTTEPLELFEGCDRIAALRGGRLVAVRPTADWTPETLGRALLGVGS